MRIVKFHAFTYMRLLYEVSYLLPEGVSLDLESLTSTLITTITTGGQVELIPEKHTNLLFIGDHRYIQDASELVAWYILDLAEHLEKYLTRVQKRVAIKFTTNIALGKDGRTIYLETQ